ncbi:MAG: hypothetical protein ND895_27280 [Pyrinomonadaceae bacterium]|nr:hypothetical protein [Pyrinomonadaceae bacterium]
MKIVPPLFLTAATVLVALAMFTQPFDLLSEGFIGLVFLVAATSLTWWWAGRLKGAIVDEENLYVLGWMKVIAIPLEEIDHVWDMSGGYPVFVNLKSMSEFGRRIVFIAPQSLLFMFDSHPVAAELRELVKNAVELKRNPTSA